MTAHINTFGLRGVNGFLVDAEINISKGLPYLDIIGMGNTAVRESAGRIRAAIENMGYDMPLGRITVNLAPAGVRKEGACYDLAIAMGILKCAGCDMPHSGRFGFIGELSLDGFLRPVRGVLSMVKEAARIGIRKCIVPVENADEAALIDSCEIYPVASVQEAVHTVCSFSDGSGEVRTPWKYSGGTRMRDMRGEARADFADVKGQEQAVRAAELAAAGGHNILFMGAPGCGKTMIATRMAGILPELTKEEALEVTPVYSVLNMPESASLITRPPFRTVYPDVTKAGLTGGGGTPVPGEISLAHKGILFLDELAEFGRNVIQCLRQPMETGAVSISRCGETVTFPAEFMLVAASNPCRCGNLFENGKCICTPFQAKEYLSRISRPVLDRIDIQVPVRRVDLENTESGHTGESSEAIRDRVIKARLIQSERYRNESVRLNGRLDGALVRKYCAVDAECERLLRICADREGISVRGYEKILKIARTAADLEGRRDITSKDIAEAVQYRFLDSYFQEAV